MSNINRLKIITKVTVSKYVYTEAAERFLKWGVGGGHQQKRALSGKNGYLQREISKRKYTNF